MGGVLLLKIGMQRRHLAAVAEGVSPSLVVARRRYDSRRDGGATNYRPLLAM
jgi:hypothetical protein